MSKRGISSKSVQFDLSQNTEHLCTVLYPKGPKKPGRADTRSSPPVPVDLEQKGIVKAYLENEDEQYKGFVLLQLINNQDGSFLLRFIDPVTKERFNQTFMQDRIDEIIQGGRKSPKLK